MKTKICSGKCGLEKPLSDFGNDKFKPDGHRPDCKECRNKVSRIFYEDNKKHINKRHKKHYNDNKEDYSKRHIKYNQNRINSDPAYKILSNFRTRLLRALNGKLKIETSIKLLGCTPHQLKQHLESQFTEDMSWDNYGLYGWHIDHIKPCAKFDLSKESEQRKCFHYTNLQPLWALENWSKGNTYIDKTIVVSKQKK